MARTIDSAVQTALETDLGTEINVVLEIFWSNRSDTSIQTFPAPIDAVERQWYSDKVIDGYPEVKPVILSLSNVDAAVQVTQGGQSKSVTVELDDTNGELKELFDTNDMHKTPCRVWFHVKGTDFATKKFPIFLGQINTPIIWDEGKRTFSFAVVNRIEDVEVGFSYEEGSASEMPEDLIGQPFPLTFGTTTNVPALKAVPTLSGVLAGGVGIKDFTLNSRLQLAEAITCPRTPIGFKCSGAFPNQRCSIAYEDDQNCLQAKCVELEVLKLQLAEQSAYEYATVIIFGGENLPQGWNTNTPTTGGGSTPVRAVASQSTGRLNELTLNINGGLFTGYFDGTPESPSQLFVIRSRQHPRYDPATGTVVPDPVSTLLDSECPSSNFNAQDSNFTDTFSGPVWTGLRNSRISWENYRNAAASDFFWAPGGSTVTIENVREIVYIANLVPSTIHSVKAKRFLNGNEFLLTVPSEFFEIRETDYGGYTGVMEVVFQRPLSSESKDTGGGWSDEIYITQTSSVGPNTVDIIEWFINTYTDYAIDSTSFADAKTKLEVYPMHFPLLRRPGLISILQELAKKARCALWQRDDTFFIKYLAEEPTPVATLEFDDILQSQAVGGRNLFKMELTKTEDLVTKHTSEWRDDYGPFTPKPKKLILRHNIKRYGTHDETEDYFPYRHLDLVRKSATFWLIRSANTWKRLRLTTSLEFVSLEPFDAVTIRLSDVARDALGEPSDVIGIVERAILDSTGKKVELEIWTPVRAGELTPYAFAFPAFISENALFPTLEAREAGDAGSGKDPNFQSVAPPGHPLAPDRRNIFSGFALGCNGDGVTSLEPGECRQDHGDRKPSDTGDKKPGVDTSADTSGDVSGSTSPVSNGAGYGVGSKQWLQDQAQKKTEGDAGRAREVSEGGGTGDSPNSGDGTEGGGIDQPTTQEDLDNLPDPEELDEGMCRYEVVITAFRTKSSVVGVPSQETCTPDGPVFEETYVFDSRAVSEEFCSSVTGRPSCGGKPACNTCIAACRITQKGNCDDGDGDGNIIGYSAGSNTGTPVMLGG